MHLSDIDYDLPQKLIAQHPIEPRDAARLLVDIDQNTSNNEVAHRHVSDFVEFVRPGDVVVVNHTRVMPARVILHRASGGVVEALLLEEKDANTAMWETLLRPGGKLKVGEILYSLRTTNSLLQLQLRVCTSRLSCCIVFAKPGRQSARLSWWWGSTRSSRFLLITHLIISFTPSRIACPKRL